MSTKILALYTAYATSRSKELYDQETNHTGTIRIQHTLGYVFGVPLISSNSEHSTKIKLGTILFN